MENAKKYREIAKNIGILAKNIGKCLVYLAKNIGKCLRDTHKQQQLVLAQGQHNTNILTLAYRKTHHIMHVVHGLYCHMYLKCHFYL